MLRAQLEGYAARVAEAQAEAAEARKIATRAIDSRNQLAARVVDAVDQAGTRAGLAQIASDPQVKRWASARSRAASGVPSVQTIARAAMNQAAEVRQLFDLDLTTWWRAFITTAILCGLRPRGTARAQVARRGLQGRRDEGPQMPQGAPRSKDRQAAPRAGGLEDRAVEADAQDARGRRCRTGRAAEAAGGRPAAARPAI